MALVGTVCCQTGSNEDFDHCIGECRKGQCDFPLPLLTNMANSYAGREGTGLSATTILGCPRQFVLTSNYPYYESPANYHARWRGNGIHAMMEADSAFEGIIQEQRIRKPIEVDGETFEVTGQPDWVDVEHRHIEDWKSTKQVPAQPYPDHEAQVNIYAWLVDGGEWDDVTLWHIIPPIEIQSAGIRYIDAERSVLHMVPIWSTDAVEGMIRRRLRPLAKHMKDGTIPDGIAGNPHEKWKTRYCPFVGTGQCCADTYKDQEHATSTEPGWGEVVE